MNISFAHICDYASVSREGKLSVNGIFDSINVQQLPAVHPSMYLAFDVTFSAAEFGRTAKIEIELVDADGNKVLRIGADGKFDRGPGMDPSMPIHAPMFLAFGGVQFTRPGAHSFNIFINSDHKKDVPFAVRMVHPVAGSRGLRP